MSITHRPARPRGRARRSPLAALALALACAAAPLHAADLPATPSAPTLAPAPAGTVPPDPLRSPSWDVMVRGFLSDHPVVFDDRVRVFLPTYAEDALNVPVQVDARALDGVTRILVVADLNPIPRLIEYRPVHAKPEISFRFKVEQSTPVRAAVLAGDGVWHVGGGWLTASGGGCTTPSLGTGSKQWSDVLGQVSARLWPRPDGGSRLRLRTMHPMDTGLAAGIPKFYIELITLTDDAGRELAQIEPWEPISENPMISIDLDTTGPVRIIGRDIQGNRITGWVTP
ncbi:quinoprotein dehydrogenase-associated SoxYZ-like carrier [Derxia gummosa]|uniref:Quinoprotein dehydrogenase-associated SoxYZ-like carrier n=1 Tax=Derxia gummosa DSM 723 TaxID=1121388 RepID=A0A8B6XAL4_9BURK|nr:quinoprotein dehydrogenase-associated SoxYZ-like carrier [Derxia gummosa]